MTASTQSTTNDLREEFGNFLVRCMDARRIWNLYSALYEFKESNELLRRVAGAFFADVQELVVRHLVLEVCVLTDPADSGKNKDNLTVKRIENGLKENGLHSEEISDLASRLESHGDKMRLARSKIIAHADLATSLSRHHLGQAPEDAWRLWWDNLQAFCDETGRAIGVGPSDFLVQAEPGDAHDLLKFLHEAEQAGVCGRPSQRVTSDN